MSPLLRRRIYLNLLRQKRISLLDIVHGYDCVAKPAFSLCLQASTTPRDEAS